MSTSPFDSDRVDRAVRDRLRPIRRWFRRTVLARRRVLAALLVGVAVAAGLRATMPPPPPTEPVVVAGRDLAAGATLTSADIVTAPFAPDTVPDGLADDFLGRTLAAPLRRGEPVTDVRLVAPSLTHGYPGLVAIPVRLPDPGAVGLLAAGDRIDVFAVAPRSGDSRLLVAGARVLAVPLVTAAVDTGALTGRLVVLGVPEPTVAGLAGAGVRDFLSFAFSR